MSVVRFIPAATLIAFVSLAFATATPSAVSVGHEILFDAPAQTDLGTKKPKLQAMYVGPLVGAKGDPKLKLKVTTHSSTSFNATVKKAKGAGVFDVVATPKGGDPILMGQVSTLPPAPTDTSSDTVVPKGELTITGTLFGTKKPRVFINGKKAKTLTSSDTSIRVRAHKKTPGGMADIIVQTTVGESTLADAVTVAVDPPTGGPKPNQLTGSSSGDYRARLRMRDDEVDGSWDGPSGFSVSGSQTTRNVVEDIEFEVRFDLAGLIGGTKRTLNASAGETFYLELSGGTARQFELLISGQGTSAEITIDSFDPNTRFLDGSFEADLLDTASGERISISGDFSVTLDDNRP